jgi:hypothetical protein
LRATYTTVAQRGPDLENLLFYNVGSPPFAKLGRDLIRFERVVERPPEPAEKLDAQLLHHVCYRIEQQSASFPSTAGISLAESKADIALKTVDRLWRAFKENLHVSDPRGLTIKRFAVQLIVSAPAHCRLDTKLKALFDAFLSALHSYSGGQLEQVVCRLAASLRESEGLVRDLLVCDPQHAILGPRSTPHLRGATLQWSPADDQLAAAEVIRVPAPTNCSSSVCARLFGLP